MADKQFMKGAVTGVLCASLVLGGGYVGLQKAGRAGSNVLSDVAVTQKIKYLEDIIDQNYLEDVDEDSLKEGIYTGLLYGLGDPYSRYYTEKEYEEEMRDTEGSYSGIGVSITQNTEGGILVVDCYEGSPADEAGLKANDVITAVNGTDVTEMTPAEVSKMIREKEDGTSILTVYHQEADEPEEITVTLSDVELPTVSYEMLEDSIGYLRITEFTMVTPQQFEDAYKDLQAKGMEKLIVDLRDNPGGVLSSVCDVLRQILPEGLIVYTEDKYGEKQEMKCDGDTPIDIPLAVLAATWIREHINDVPTPKQVAETFAVSEDHLSRLVKREYGVTLHEYTTRARLNYAAELLSSSPGMKVYEAGEAAGYPDYKYFHAVFTRYFGVSPTDYRKNAETKKL